MQKIVPGDIKAILRGFGIDGANNSDRHIESVKVINPHPSTFQVAFRFNRHRYVLIFDDQANDNVDYLLDQIKNGSSNEDGQFIKNPKENFITYGLPYKGKTVYLYLAQVMKKRLDVYLAETYPNTSRSTWQKHIKSGHVAVNGATIISPRFEVTPNDIINIATPKLPDFSKMTLPLIYKDDNVIVINKPIGILTHSKGALVEEFSVADFFKQYSEVGLNTNRPGIVHRLDRDTSGVMIGARTESAAQLLKRQFSDRKAKKNYIAVLSGHLKEKDAVVDLPIERNPSAPSTFRVDSNGRSAVTHFRVLAENTYESLVELRPVTGRTHQLRVHMSYLGAPIKGDRVYGREGDRLYLHAQKLEITIPPSDRRIFEAPLPPEFLTGFDIQL